MALLNASEVAIALSRTRKPIELRDLAGVRVKTLAMGDVAAYLEREYEVHGTKRRIRYVKPAGPKMFRPELPFIVCHRTANSATLWPYVDSEGVTA